MRQTIIFDLDGTLTQSEEGIWNCVRYAAERMGRPVPDAATLRKFVGPPLYDSFRTYMGMDDAEAEEAVRLYRERYIPVGKLENRVYPGIRRLLRTLRRMGATLCVATGKPEKTSVEILEHFGLADCFARIAGPDGATKDASKKELILRAMDGLPEADAVWMVGDRKYDIEGGRDAGVRTIGVGYGYGSEEELRGAGCDQYCGTVEDLIAFLCGDAEPPRGAFLSIEGLDGSGKSTQIALLTDALERHGYEVVHSREPGGCPVAERIREVILSRENSDMEPLTEALLYAASRAQHVRQVIRPAIRAGKVLLCDRFVDSSIAYQGGGRGLGVDLVTALNAEAVDGTLPQATVYLDIRHEESLRRRLAASEPDRLEAEGDAFHARVEQAYRELIARDPDRFVVVDATEKPEEIGAQVAAAVLARLAAMEQE